MFVKGYKQTEEHKKKIGLALKGRPSYHKGRKRPNISQKLKGNKNGFKKGQIGYWKDKKLPSKFKHDKPHTEEAKLKMRINSRTHGKRPPNFKGSLKWKKNQVRMKDDYTCRIYGLRDPEIVEVDHIIPRAINPEFYLNVDNLQTLCPNCHSRKTKKDKKIIAEKNKGIN